MTCRLRQTIIWTRADLWLIGSPGTNFNELCIKIRIFSFMKMRLKMSSAKWRTFCPGLNVLNRASRRFHCTSMPCLLMSWPMHHQAINTLQRCHERHGISSHWPLDCLLKNLFMLTSNDKKEYHLSALMSLCEGNPPVIGGFPSPAKPGQLCGKRFQARTSSWVMSSIIRSENCSHLRWMSISCVVLLSRNYMICICMCYNAHAWPNGRERIRRPNLSTDGLCFASGDNASSIFY